MSVPRVFPYQNQLVAIGIVPPSERSAKSVVSGRFRFPFSWMLDQAGRQTLVGAWPNA